MGFLFLLRWLYKSKFPNDNHIYYILLQPSDINLLSMVSVHQQKRLPR